MKAAFFALVMAMVLGVYSVGLVAGQLQEGDVCVPPRLPNTPTCTAPLACVGLPLIYDGPGHCRLPCGSFNPPTDGESASVESDDDDDRHRGHHSSHHHHHKSSSSSSSSSSDDDDNSNNGGSNGGSTECPPERYCADSVDYCLALGECTTLDDCFNPDNVYPIILCLGLVYCNNEGRCAVHCGTGCTAGIDCPIGYTCDMTDLQCKRTETVKGEPEQCSTCPPPFPGAPNFICPDGSIGGPICVHDQTGPGCHFEFRQCPGQSNPGFPKPVPLPSPLPCP